VTAIGFYSFCSGTLLLFNKIVVVLIPCAPFVTATQFCFTIIVLGSLHVMGIVAIQGLDRQVLTKYALYVVIFIAGIYSNMQALRFANVDTVIVFRSATPIVVSCMDFLFLGRELPSPRSLGALGIIIMGSLWYVYCDESRASKEEAPDYTWPIVYTCVIAIEMTYGKLLIRDLKLNLTTTVFVTNALALVPMVCLGLLRGEMDLQAAYFTPYAVAMLALSCIVSSCIGYSSWGCRSIISATSFTIVGVLNKISTILLNIAIWDKHANALGTIGLLLCLGGGALYQQAPLRTVESKTSENV